MQYIESPQNYTKMPGDVAIFFAGGITNCPDWQSEIVDALRDINITILNPRRKFFPINDSTASKEQIKWEYSHLRKADVILFWFPKESICPIALYELGAWCMTTKPIYLGVDSEYPRKTDIEIQTALIRPDVEINYSLNELIKKIMIKTESTLEGGNNG